jgi:hypothetical protein
MSTPGADAGLSERTAKVRQAREGSLGCHPASQSDKMVPLAAAGLGSGPGP